MSDRAIIAIDLAEMINVDREKKGLTLAEYASKIGIAETTLKSMLKGHENITLFTLSLIAKELGISYLPLHFFELTSDEERMKHREITLIQTRLLTEPPQVIHIIRDTLEDEISKIKKIMQSLNP